MPPNLFYGTGIPACIIVIDKENAQGRTGVFMIDASKGFIKDGNKNRLRHQDIHKIVDIFNRQIELPEYSHMVSLAEIEANDFNLNIPRYIDSSEPEDLQDIEAHLLGGIPNRDIDDLSCYWEVFPTLKEQLFSPGSRPGYSELRAAASKIKTTIIAHPEFMAYTQAVNEVFARWKADNVECLKSITIGSHPRQLITALSEDLLDAFAEVMLIDRYDIYQHLMSYWTETMQDDVYMIVSDGWKENIDLIPPDLLIKHYFITENQGITTLTAERDAIAPQMSEMDEEYGSEGSYLDVAKNDKGKITKNGIINRLRDVNLDQEATDDERSVLNNYLSLMEKESATNKKIQKVQKALDKKVATQYKALSEDKVKTLVVEDKWLTALSNDVQSGLERISQALTGRIKELAERYAEPLSSLVSDVEILSGKVDTHLRKMGFL